MDCCPHCGGKNWTEPYRSEYEPALQHQTCMDCRTSRTLRQSAEVLSIDCGKRVKVD